jgi:hypothetical protein
MEKQTVDPLLFLHEKFKCLDFEMDFESPSMDFSEAKSAWN